MLHLGRGTLTCEMKAHSSSADAARAGVDSFLRAWELDVALQQGRCAMWVVDADAERIIRHPPPPGTPQMIALSGMKEAVEVINRALLHLTSPNDPGPPTRFIVSPGVETL
jgi:hypothetical protein